MASKPLVDSKIPPEHIYDSFLTCIMAMQMFIESHGGKTRGLDEIVQDTLETAESFRRAELGHGPQDKPAVAAPKRYQIAVSKIEWKLFKKQQTVEIHAIPSIYVDDSCVRLEVLEEE
jgi:hypothetical protein